MTSQFPSGTLSRRTLLKTGGLVGAAAATAALLAACTDGAVGAGGGSTSKATLKLALSGSAADRPVWIDMIKQFEKAHPGITVSPQFFTSPPGTDAWTNFFTTLQTRILGGEKYDVAVIATEGQLLFASKGLLEPFDEYIKKDKAAVDNYKSDIDPHVLQQIQAHSSPDGKTYFLPFGQNTEGIWYRPSMFKAAGVSEPTADWTLDDLSQAAVKLSDPAKKVYGITFGIDLFGFGPWLQSEGGRYLSDDWKRSTINSEGSARALTMAADLVRQKAAPAPGGVFDPNVAMSKGQLAMQPAGRWPVLAFREQKFDMSDLRIVPFPKGSDGSRSTVGYGAMGILKSSTNKDAAWEFIKYTISPDFAQYHAKTGFQGSSPVRLSAATGSAIQQDSPEGTPNLYKAIGDSIVVPGVPRQAALATPFTNTLTQVLNGSLSPAKGLEAIDAAWRQALQS